MSASSLYALASTLASLPNPRSKQGVWFVGVCEFTKSFLGGAILLLGLGAEDASGEPGLSLSSGAIEQKTLCRNWLENLLVATGAFSI